MMSYCSIFWYHNAETIHLYQISNSDPTIELYSLSPSKSPLNKRILSGAVPAMSGDAMMAHD